MTSRHSLKAVCSIVASLMVNGLSTATACPPNSEGTLGVGMMNFKASAQLSKPVCGSTVNPTNVEIKSAADHYVMASVPMMAAGSSTQVDYELQVTDDNILNGSYRTAYNIFITFDDMGRWKEPADLIAFEDVAAGAHTAEALCRIRKSGVGNGLWASASHTHDFTADPNVP